MSGSALLWSDLMTQNFDISFRRKEKGGTEDKKMDTLVRGCFLVLDLLFFKDFGFKDFFEVISLVLASPA